MNLPTAANLAEILGFFIVLVGLGFGILQLVQYRRQRRDMGAIELARAFQTPEFARAMRLVTSLPRGSSAEEVRQRGPQFEDAAALVVFNLETIGIMVHRRIISLDLAWELAGGQLLAAWERLEDWTHAVRTEQGRDKFAEWVEWLVDRLRQHVRQGDLPAHRKFADWQP